MGISFDLKDKVALVTGGRRGIGLSVARAFKKAGARVAVCAKSKNGPEDIDLYLQADLSDRKERSRIIQEVIGTLGPIDILINNAGDQHFAPAVNYPLEIWDKDVELLLTSVFHLCQLVGKEMINRGYGKIINIASIVSFQGARNTIGYVSAKTGLIGLTKSLSNEWAGYGVNVNAIAPGYIETDMLKHLIDDAKHSKEMLGRIPAGRYGSGEDVAGAALYLASSASDYVTGICIPVDGGWLGR